MMVICWIACLGLSGVSLQGETVIRRNGAKAGNPVVGADFQLTPRSGSAKAKVRGVAAIVDPGDNRRDGGLRLTAWEECSLIVSMPPPFNALEPAKEMIIDGRSGIWWQSGANCRMQWYERHDGCFEWEICLDAPPPSNIFSFPIHSNDLVLCYQGELSPEETAEGAFRPDSVIGSYAVYHATRRDDRTVIHGADTVVEQYGTGKAFHIYRPKAYDANGVTCWCDLKIDRALNITVPSDFLLKATYPVTIDPTFGYTSAGATSTIPGTARANINDAHTHVAGVGETITSFSAYVSSSSGTQSLGLAAYTMDNGTPKLPVTRLASSATVSITGGTPLWYTTSTQSQNLTSGTRYCVALGDGNSSVGIYYDSYGAAARSNNSTAALPATWTNGGTGTVVFSLYATYTVNSSVIQTRRRRHMFMSNSPEQEGSAFHEAIQFGRSESPDANVGQSGCHQRFNGDRQQ